jgi:RNA polymerase sigma-70 factor (ECF subfamily)
VTNFEDLYRQFAPSVYRFALYLTAERALAEDITSETFVRAWTSASQVRITTVKAYLLTIARNLYVEELRRRGRHTELDETVADRSDLIRQTEIRDALGKAAKQLQQIAEGDRAALLMRLVDEMSYEEIASTLGISIAAVKTRIFRARLRLTQLQEALEWKT